MDSAVFDIDQDYILENDIVLLRPLIVDDYDHLLPFALNEPELWKFSLVSAAGAEAMKAYITQAVEARRAGREYPFIIFDKRINQYAGCTRFYDIQPIHATMQLGYTWYGKSFQRTGLNRHCKYLLLEFAFEQLQIKRVEFRADNNNERSITAMKNIGCAVEGILRSNYLTSNGTRRDSIVLSILQDEWYNSVKHNLKSKIK